MEAWGRKCYFHASVENTAQNQKMGCGTAPLTVDRWRTFFSSEWLNRQPVV